MLLSLMYHRVGVGKHANPAHLFEEHFKYLKENFPIVLPGDPLTKRTLSLCLTFDDATFDFYHFIFPLLKKYEIRAVLGVPVHYILESTDISVKERLSVPYPLAMQEGFFEKKAPFCTWQELNEMSTSGLVEMASHSYLHCNLTFDFVDLQREVVYSKEILENKIKQPVSSFIYPFGKTTPTLHEYVKEHYPYSFRIGSALNKDWGKNNKPISRVIADNMSHASVLFSPLNLAKYFGKSLMHWF